MATVAQTSSPWCYPPKVIIRFRQPCDEKVPGWKQVTNNKLQVPLAPFPTALLILICVGPLGRFPTIDFIDLPLLQVFHSFDNRSCNRWNNLTFIRMIRCECNQNKLRAIWHLEISRVVTRRTCPTCFRPELDAFNSLQRDAAKSMSLIVSVVARAGVVAFQQVHH